MTAVSRLLLTDFRNHSALMVEARPGLIALTGNNGAGKTNLLEAVSLLTPGRGLRGAALSDMARTGGAGGFAVAARLDDASEIGTGTAAAAPERRQVRINAAAAAATALAERLALVWLTPAMDRLFTDSPGGRRRFLDRLVLALEPGHALHSTRYEAAMRARNKLLAEARDAAPDAAWLTALEAAMAEHGIAIAAARARCVDALGHMLEGQPPGPFARAGLAIEGWAATDAETFAAELTAQRLRDAAAGRALAGPHRNDLAVFHVEKNQPAGLCSTGEQKALLLGIVLAHASLVASRRGERPILLLDEVAAHLDPRRRAILFARLAEEGGQVWMTGTEAALFADAPKETQRLILVDGALRED